MMPAKWVICAFGALRTFFWQGGLRSQQRAVSITPLA